MKKEVIIIPEDGDFQRGFGQLTIKILEEGKNDPDDYRQIYCQLPQTPEILNHYQKWQEKYQLLLKSSRDEDSRGFIRSQTIQISVSECIAECDKSLEALRSSLNHWLRTTKQQLEQSIDINSQDEIRVVIQTHKISSEITKNILHKLPWHWWDLFTDDCFGEVALSFVASGQFSPAPDQNSDLEKPKRVKILCILGDSGKGIDVEADRRLLRKIPGAYCVFLRQPTLEELKSFLNQRWDILFFAGHSDAPGDGKTGLLKINSEESLDIQTIRETIQRAIEQGMKLAIFNSCNGLGLARQLADLDIAQIIVWREPVPDKVAQEFLKYFLEFFPNDLSLYRSVQSARIKLQNYIEKMEVSLPKVSWLPVIHHNLAKECITWKQLRRLPNTDIHGNKKSPRESLLNKVEESWIKGVLEQSLHIEETIELSLSECLDAVRYPSRRQGENSNQQNRDLPAGTRAIDIFGELENKRTLLILGEPGSGKTTALLEIAREFISDARQDTTLPIPVVLNLSSWAGERRPKPLADWLVQELNRIYQFSKKQCQAWITNQQLLLLLDGLDEVRESQRGAFIRAINQFLGDYEKTEIVVCCRIQDYNQASEKLQFQSAVFYKSLTEEQINRYLDDAKEELSAVKELKEEDEAIQELVKNPLTLNIIAVAYKDKSREELLQINSLKERRSHLLNTYIQRRFEEEQLSDSRSTTIEPRQLKYSENQSVYWLSWLAQKMIQKSQQVFLIEHIQPDWLQAITQEWMYLISSRLILGLIVGLIGILHFGTQITDDLSVHIFLIIPSMIIGVISVFVSLVLSKIIPIFISQNRYQNMSRLLPESLSQISYKYIYKFISGVISGLIYVIVSALMIYPLVSQKLVIFLSPLIIDGVVLSFFLSLIEFEEIGLIDTIEPSWNKARKYSIVGLICGLLYVLVRLFLGRYDLSNPKDIFDIFIELLILTTLPGLIGFLDKGVNLEQTILPNQGVRRSAQNARFFFLLFFPVGILCSLNYLDGKFYKAISIALAVALLAGLAGGRGPVFAGLVLIQHFTLRVILWLQGYTPWNYARFLDYATERFFLRRVGGGYIFIHRMLQEHFASSQR